VQEEFAVKLFIRSVAVILVAVVMRSSVAAQWPPYPTPEVSRLANGQPNLEGPAPRTPQGTSDLSGLWRYVRRPGLPEPQAGALGQPRVGTSQFWDIGTGLAEPIPFTPWARDVLAKRMADNSKDNPDAHCLPIGIMQLHTHGDPRRIVQTPRLIVMLYEANTGVRQIYTDGRPLPNNDPQPWYHGYSVGRWQGDTLIVETVGLRDDGWLDVNGTPLTSTGKLTERFRRGNFGTLDIEVTVEDPKAYTRPWTAHIRQQIMLDTDLFEFVCQENEKSTRNF
jgi:hypothetical protein